MDQLPECALKFIEYGSTLSVFLLLLLTATWDGHTWHGSTDPSKCIHNRIRSRPQHSSVANYKMFGFTFLPQQHFLFYGRKSVKLSAKIQNAPN